MMLKGWIYGWLSEHETFFAKYSVFHVFLHIRDPKITLMSTKSDVLYNCKPWVAILKMLRTICQEQRFSILPKAYRNVNLKLGTRGLK